MERCRLIKSISNEIIPDVCLHEDILDILFKHKKEIHKKLIDLRGIFLLDHIAIKIIDPKGKMVIFSMTPSVEYNLLFQGLWKHDKSFSIDFQKDNIFYPWEKAYSKEHFFEIKRIKELKHGFALGFNVSKKIGLFHFIYSYAIRSQNSELLEYYRSHINQLFALGDYGYKLIRPIYEIYSDSSVDLISLTTIQYSHNQPYLQLIVNQNEI